MTWNERLTGARPQAGHGINLVGQGVDMAVTEIQLTDAHVVMSARVHD